MRSEKIAEVVESNTTEMVAQCYQLHHAPAFGSFVRVESEPTVIGVVFNVSTHSLEPNRRATALGLTPEQLAEDQPQIAELLRTEIQALLIGYEDSGPWRQLLPPHPPRIHSFVYPCTAAEVSAFTTHPDYLRMLINSNKVSADELVIATVRTAVKAHGDDRQFLVNSGKELAKLLKTDYDRLNSLLRRIAQ